VRKRRLRRNRELALASGISPLSTGRRLGALAFHDRIEFIWRPKMHDREPSPVLIELYPGRRLYDGEIGRYRSLDELRVWKQRQVPFLVIDFKTGDDVTEKILS
jgi:PHB/PHA accumulation regulator DNA-binding domain